jgi:hypothetical protein
LNYVFDFVAVNQKNISCAELFKLFREAWVQLTTNKYERRVISDDLDRRVMEARAAEEEARRRNFAKKSNSRKKSS